MKIALVHDWLLGMRGGEKCLEVFCELYPDADLFTLLYVPGELSPVIARMKIHESWIGQLPLVRRCYRYCLPVFPRTIEAFDFSRYDLILSSSHCVAKGVIPSGALHISYIHSPMRYVWDQHDAYFGADASWLARAGMALWRRHLQEWDLRSSERVDYFIANSKNVAAKIQHLYSRGAAVIYPPVDLERFYILKEQQPYYLVVSALVPYKKINIAIDAFNELKLPLKVVGEGPLRKRLEKMAQPNIEFLGWISDDALPGLYAASQALIFPGDEDFGIVPLEAQASGRPVIAYGRGGVLETVVPLNAGDRRGLSGEEPTGVLFQQANAESLMAAVEQFGANKQSFSPAAIRRHACGFSRNRFKAQIGDYVGNCLRDGVRGK
jgi:glycosyltransferase involved in cell wall biosynthesis